jgi:hypothetical protein
MINDDLIVNKNDVVASSAVNRRVAGSSPIRGASLYPMKNSLARRTGVVQFRYWMVNIYSLYE